MQAWHRTECPRRQGRVRVAMVAALLASVVHAVAWAAEPVTPAPAPSTPAPAPSTPAPAPSSPAPAPEQQPPAQAPSAPPASGPGSTPAQIPPPPAYSPPPEYYAPPPYAYPQYRSWTGYRSDEDDDVFRPLSLTLAIGPGMIIGPGERSAALSYNIFRLGIGIVRNLSFIISYEGAGTNSTNPATGQDSWLSQNQWIFGLQLHFLRWFYVRAGIGPGSVEETTRSFYFSNGTSLTYAGALGFEFLRTEYLALGFEASVSTTHYEDESWQTLGWDLTLAFY